MGLTGPVDSPDRWQQLVKIGLRHGGTARLRRMVNVMMGCIAAPAPRSVTSAGFRGRSSRQFPIIILADFRAGILRSVAPLYPAFAREGLEAIHEENRATKTQARVEEEEHARTITDTHPS